MKKFLLVSAIFLSLVVSVQANELYGNYEVPVGGCTYKVLVGSVPEMGDVVGLFEGNILLGFGSVSFYTYYAPNGEVIEIGYSDFFFLNKDGIYTPWGAVELRHELNVVPESYIFKLNNIDIEFSMFKY